MENTQCVHEQRTSTFTVQSTFLSQMVGGAIASFFTASSRLDQGLMLEIAGLEVYGPSIAALWSESLMNFRSTRARIDHILHGLTALETQMDRLQYEDSHVLKAMDYDDLLQRHSTAGILHPCPEWTETVSVLRQHGYRQLYAILRSRFEVAKQQTDAVVDLVTCLWEAAQKGGIHDAIELTRDFRDSFNMALTSWLSIGKLFQISALMGNEVHYLTCPCISR